LEQRVGKADILKMVSSHLASHCEGGLVYRKRPVSAISSFTFTLEITTIAYGVKAKQARTFRIQTLVRYMDLTYYVKEIGKAVRYSKIPDDLFLTQHKAATKT
jgi:hypothetical protein